MTEDDGEDLLRGIGGNGSSTGLYEYGLHDHHPGSRMRREGPPGLVVDDIGVVRRASSIGVSPMSSSRGGGGGGEPGRDYESAGMRMGSGGGASNSSGRQGLYHGLHHHHIHDSTHEGGGSGSGGRGGGIGVGGDDMGNCGGMRVCGGIDPLASPRMDPIGVGVDDTASEDDDDEEDVEEDEEEEDSSEISASDEDGSWIEWFCGLRGNEFFCEVDEDYIQDDFNLTGLYGLVPCYERALDMVLDVEMPMEDTLTEEQHEIVESAAEMLYGMIHARYIVTSRGMNAMYEKYRSATFGRCPHVYCQGQPVLPVGLSDMPRNYTVNVFCPRCHGLFFPKSTRQANIDGAYFGTTFPHLYLMTHPEIIPVRPSQQYVPRVYGFRINQSSLYYRFHEGEEEDNSGQNENRALTRSSRSRQR
jgi:casein kinase II subunit beta